MKALFLGINALLRENAPSIRTIDLDRGQLGNPEGYEPPAYPAVLVQMEILWSSRSMAKDPQEGQASITLTLLTKQHTHTDTQHDSHEAGLAQTFEAEEEVFLALQNEGVAGLTTRALTRSQSRTSYHSGGRTAQQMTFTCRVKDERKAEARYVKIPHEQKIKKHP